MCLPRSLSICVRFGPGIVIVLTWLGAGDVVDMGVAGSNYGYALMWVLVAAIIMRFLFVSLIARYQLCNQHGESVLDGLARLHRWYAPGILIATIVMGHVYGAYMTVGIGEVCRNLFRAGQTWQWALAANLIALALVFQPAYERLEWVFKFFLAVLAISFIGSAVWVGFNPAGVLQGLYRFEMPDHQGRFNPLLVAGAMIGAIGGSLMNLVYPYFLKAKGWDGPEYRRVQFYDFLLAVTFMIFLNLAVWTLGAELLYPDTQIKELDDLPRLLSSVLGEGGRWLFYAGIFSAIYTSILGHASGLAMMGSHAVVANAGWNKGNHSRLSLSLGLPGDRRLVSRVSAHLDHRGYARFRDPHSGRQQRTGSVTTCACRRAMVDYGELPVYRPRISQSLVGERGDVGALPTGDLRCIQLCPLDRAVPE